MLKVMVSYFVGDTEGYDCTRCCVSFGFAGTNTTASFNVVMYSFLCNLIDIVGILKTEVPLSPCW